MNRVAIIDYGVGNLRSVEKAFAATGCEAVISSDESFLRNVERLVLPGVGAFAACMKALEERGFDRRVRKFDGELVVPQVGWNRIQQKRPHALFEGIANGSFCYFVHSFYCEPGD